MTRFRNTRFMHDDAGAVAVTVAITLTVLVLMAAFVLDIAQLRADRVQSKAAADMSAVAAAVTYDPEAANSMRAACEDAVAFAEANLPAFRGISGSPDCTVFPTTPCAASTLPATAVFTGGPYTLRITSPVPYGPLASGVDLMEGLVHDADHDGSACERIGVQITRDRDYRLAQVGGFTSGVTSQASVARWKPGGDEDIFASLVILQAEGCASLRNSGQDQGNLIVGSATVIIDGETVELPGTITSDTVPNSGCSGGNNWSNRTIAVQDNGQALIRADGRIFTRALEEGFATTRVYYPNVVTTDPAATSGLYPRPSAGPAVKRRPVDHLFNCKATYPTDQSWSPAWTGSQGLSIPGCTPENPPPPYIENLWNALSPANWTATLAAAAADWSVFPDDVPGADCTSATGTFGPGAPTPSSANWFINCPSPNGQAFQPEGISFLGVENVVSRNQIRLGGGEDNALTIEGDTGAGAVLFVQNGSISRTGQARVYLIDTFVYLENGMIDFGGNNPGNAGLNNANCSSTTQAFGVCWHAPSVSLTGCEGYVSGLPPAACFQPLALWSNSGLAHELGGQVTFDISGSFFTPNATPFRLAGQSLQDFTRAQFFTSQLSMSGKAPVLMAPNPDTNIPIQLPGTALIR